MNRSLSFNYNGYNSSNYAPWTANSNPRVPCRRIQIHNSQRRDLSTLNCYDEHWCETCDRGFQTSDLLQRHKQQHQKCNIDGCQFVAHPKVITKHIQMQHSSGLYKKIAKLDNPEEVKKWIEERKKKYPTKSNIEQKAAEIKEKINRGEKMGLKHKTNIKKCDTGRGVKTQHIFETHNNKYNQNNKRKFPSNIKKKPPLKQDISIPSVNEKRKLKPFTGIQDLIMHVETDENVEQSQDNFLIEDDEEPASNSIQDSSQIQKQDETKVCNALSSLICNYESSDEEMEFKDNKTTDEQLTTFNALAPCVLAKELLNVKSNAEDTNVDINKSDDDSSPEEVTYVKKTRIDSEDSADQTVSFKKPHEITLKRKHNLENKPKKHIFKRPKPKLPSTLLEKLLYREIQQERNIVLQCIRYIVKNNYFDTNK